MQYTNHYNLNLPEGSDIVNPLVQDNPNYTAIDTALYDNKVRTVGNATEIKSGTVHAITRSDSDIDVMKFTATGDWITGDTMTVDGTPVSVYLQDGTAPLTGAYVINTEVIAAISGSRVTLYGAQQLPTNTASDVQDAIDEVVTEIPHNYLVLKETHNLTGATLVNTDGQETFTISIGTYNNPIVIFRNMQNRFNLEYNIGSSTLTVTARNVSAVASNPNFIAYVFDVVA